eukprot:TRINITY_DN21171_c0_g1_i2.p1 TRINITY_DN21171_c0_g1~~TRINITY_DN21171_c0_g1_i2.p1  ORF type:complete len:792 (-),score=260.97 TRINITY_DN21171_c0_g1_i2:221-2596(-)
MEKKKRRSSQVFHFEQTEEALEENEALRDLYQNKNFIHPDPKELETIIEEGGEKEDQRARRGVALVAEDGGLVVGKGKGRRTIEGYKYWKQDDKERNKRRKSMLAKQWRGRKKPKIVFLDLDTEQKLQFIIDTREESEDEEEDARREDDCSNRLRGEEIERVRSQIVCVWGKGKEGSGSSVEDGEGCVWSSQRDLSPSGEVFSEPEPPPPEPSKSKRGKTKSGSGKPTKVPGRTAAIKKEVDTDKSTAAEKRARPAKKKGDIVEKGENSLGGDIPVVVVTEEPDKVEEADAAQEVLTMVEGSSFERGLASRESSVPSREGSVCGTSEVSLATLCSMIPAGELAELLETEDLLFCGPREVAREETIRKGRESVRRSVRRSCRLQNTHLITGSVFTEEDMLVEDHIIDNRQKQDVSIRKSTDTMSTTSATMVGAGTTSSLTSEKITGPRNVEGNTIMSAMEEEIHNEVFTNDEVDSRRPKPTPRQDPLQPPSLASLRISEVSIRDAMTPPPLSEDSKENFFLNNIPRIKVTKKGKTKRRVPELGPDRAQDSTSPNSVLKDLSNLSLEAKSKPMLMKTNMKTKMAKTSAIKKDKVNTIPTAEKTTKTAKFTTNNKVSSVGVTSRRKKKTVALSPDTTDESFCFSGNLDVVSVGERKGRRQSLRCAGGRGGEGVNYCEESERSGTVSRRGSEEGSKNSSLEGSRRNSVLATSDIPMPAAVRRSITGEFVPRLNLPSASTEPMLEVAKEVKPVVSVGDAFWSDSEEEEIISGIFGKKTLAPWEHKQKIKINRGFLN